MKIHRENGLIVLGAENHLESDAMLKAAIAALSFRPAVAKAETKPKKKKRYRYTAAWYAKRGVQVPIKKIID